MQGGIGRQLGGLTRSVLPGVRSSNSNMNINQRSAERMNKEEGDVLLRCQQSGRLASNCSAAETAGERLYQAL